MDLERIVGLQPGGGSVVGERKALIRYINLKLAALGCPTAGDASQTAFLDVAREALHLEMNAVQLREVIHRAG